MIADEERAQRQRALRALLAKPLLAAPDDGPALTLVRRHLDELQRWLRRETGWLLVADSESARLFKQSGGGGPPGGHPARSRNGEPFSRRRYVVLCLALTALSRADAQTTLGSLADDILMAAADPGLAAAGFTFALEGRADRSDLVAVVRLLLAWAVLARVAGDEDGYLSGTADVLYDIRRPVLGALLAAARGPSTITAGGFAGRLAGLTEEPVADTDDLRNQALRWRLTRRLLDEPVVYYDELSGDERAYLVSQRVNITTRIAEATGLVPELRAEGIAMADPDDDLTDVRMPEQRTDGHLTLLVAEHLADRNTVPRPELLAFVRRQAKEHATYWRKGVTDPGAEVDLLAAALDRLTALRVAETAVEGGAPVVRALPAIARFALAEPTIREPGAAPKSPKRPVRKA